MNTPKFAQVRRTRPGNLRDSARSVPMRTESFPTPVGDPRRPVRERVVESAMQSTWKTLAAHSCVWFALSVPATAFADDVNQVSGVSVEETDDATVIRVRGNANPTYSVYRLRNPLRLFVDISDSTLAAPQDAVQVDNGVVSQVAAVEYDDALTNVTRIVVGFDQDALYDVTSEGNDLVITIDGDARRLTGNLVAQGDVDRLRNELSAGTARIAALEAALADSSVRAESAEANAIRAQIAREQAERDRLQALAVNANLEATVGSLTANQSAVSSQLQATQSQHDQASVRVVALEQDLASMRTRIAELEASGERGAELEALLAQRDAEVARLATNAAPTDDAAGIDALRAQWSQTAVAPVVALSDVRFEHVDGVDRVIIQVAAGAEFLSEPWTDGRSALSFPAATLPDHLRRTLDTQAFNGPVSAISSYTDATGAVRVVVQLQDAASELVRQEGDRIVWEFTGSPLASNAVSEMPNASPIPTRGDAVNAWEGGSGVVGGAGSPFQRRPRMARKRITIDLRNADIQNVLRLLADEGNINIVASDDVTGSVTLRLRSVPLDEALAIILRSKGLGWQQEGSVLRVAPISVFEGEYERELQRMADAFGLEPLQVRLVPVNYASANDLSSLVGGVLSNRGSVSVDGRNNLLVVTDVFQRLETAEQLVRQLDNQTPQVLIEARIVETNDQFRRQLGIQWGGDFVADQSLGNATGLLFPSTVGIAGGATDGQAPTAGTSSTPNYAVNLPAPAGTGEGGAIGFTFGNLSGTFNLNLRLSAAESTGSVKIISAPRILTLDNQPASITSGVSIPVSVVSAAGAQTVFFDASLTLNVTPRVTPDGNVFLTVQVSKNEPDFENTGARGDPSIIRREASTQLLVRDGDTTVIGGIFQRNTGFSRSSVPVLGSLPIIGPLFRNSSRTDVRNELLVFITPRIVNRDVSIDQVGAGADIMRPEDD